MRILVFSHYYPPEVNAPASRTSEHCRIWAAKGHDVTVITCCPNHPNGKPYGGYKNRVFQREEIDGVNVVRVWTYLAANSGFTRRTINYLTYMVAALLATPSVKRPDVIISTSPQFFCGLAGMFAKWIRRAPWVLEIRDLWPESITAVGAMKKGFAIRRLEDLEKLAYNQADHVVAVTEAFVPHIQALRKKPGGVSVIKNGVNLELFRKSNGGEQTKSRLNLQDRFVAAYVGTHGMAHGLDTVLDAAHQLRDDQHIGFLLVGDGAELNRLRARAEELQLKNVHIAGQLPKEEMPQIWSATDASLIVLRRSDAFKKVLPSKMFEAMAMECPIILGVEGEARALLEVAGAGIAVTPEDAFELAAGIQRLANDAGLKKRLGERGLSFVRANFDRQKLAERYLEVLHSLITSPRTRQSEHDKEIRRS